MTNYIDALTKEEKSTLCSIIGGKHFKELFKKNEMEFSKIKKGFRAKTLSETVALSTAVSNIDKPFISMAVNAKVDAWLKEIGSNIERLENEGSNHETALASTMIDSFFSENIGLYFKIIGQLLDDKAREKLIENMAKIKAERDKDSKLSEFVITLEKEKSRLIEELNEALQRNEAIKAECDQRISQSERDKNELKELLAEAQRKITALQESAFEETRKNSELLASFDDCKPSILPPANSDETVSLCEVVTDYTGQKWLIRHADLSHSGHYHIFRKVEDLPPFFSNRDKIFYKDGPSNDNFYGIWNWSAIPNENDPNKDYIVSKYNMWIDAIEVIILSNTSGVDGLIECLKNGLDYLPHSRRVMFSLYASKDQYVGILCNSKDIEVKNKKVFFAEGFITAPVYEFTNDDIIQLNNGIVFYRNAFAGSPTKLCQLKRPVDIAKSIVLNSLSWAEYKSRGFIRTEYKAFKDFLSELPESNIIGQIQASCHCSVSEAERILHEFFDSVNQYVDGDSIEDTVILSAVSTNNTLLERTKSLIRADWEAENETLLEEARLKLHELDCQLSQANATLTAVQKSFEKTKSEENEILAGIAEKQKLAEDVESSVAQRIEYARMHAAEFISNMAFVGNHSITSSLSKSASKEDAPVTPDILQYRVANIEKNIDDLEKHSTWTDVIATAAFELSVAGVAESYTNGLASFLCAAFIEKQPILLVGPNALDIIQAFSAAISAQKYGVLSCDGAFSRQLIEEIGSNGEEIVAINNLLSSGWINRLPEIIQHKDVFFIASHPYAEDIQVEPKSIYNFMIPLFTEFFIDKTAAQEYCGGYFSDSFKDYMPSKESKKEIKAFSHFSMSTLIQNKINNLVTTMHGINPSTNSDDDFVFSILPYAYATMSLDKLAEAISDPQRGITISKNLRRDLHYILGDS